MRSTTTLRTLLEQPGVVVAPGAYDALSARLIQDAGFHIAYMTGAGTAVSRHGLPDLGFLGLAEMADQAARLAGAVSIPVLADADTGFGNELGMVRTVQAYERAGVAGLHVEDQAFPKRCGHLPGKELIPPGEFEIKVAAAAQARSDLDFVLVARTDARAVSGLADVCERARRYAAAGADLIFPEGLTSVDEVAKVADAAGVPLLINQVPGGQAPVLPHGDLARAGAKIVIYPSVLISAALHAVTVALTGLADGSADLSRVVSPEELFNRVGLAEWHQLQSRIAARAAAPHADVDGVATRA